MQLILYRRRTLGALLAIATLGLACCSDPEREAGARLAELRSQCQVALEGWIPRGLSSDMGEERLVVGSSTVVTLFLRVAFYGGEPLAGITFEVNRNAASGLLKDRSRLWIDVSDLADGSAKAFELELEFVDLASGDTFAVLFDPYVPRDERSEYREYARVAP